MNMRDKTMLFDFGGVLVDLDLERCISAFEALGFQLRPYIGMYAQSGILSKIERGEATIAEFCEEVRHLSGLNLTDADIVSAWEKFLVDVPQERLELLLKIKQHYHVSVLSNTNEVHWNMAQNGFFQYKGLTVNDFFEHIFLSCEMHCEKPEPEIFQRVIQTIGCPAEDIIFFDDSDQNCEAARKCGMQARLAPKNSEWFKYFDSEGYFLDN